MRIPRYELAIIIIRLLSKIIKCHACGSAMTHTYTLNKSRHKYRYYLCTNAQKRGYDECPQRYVSTQAAEDEVIKLLRRQLQDKITDDHKAERKALLSPIWNTLFFEERRRIIQTLLKEIDCDAKNQKLGLLLTDSTKWLTFDVNMKNENARMRIRKARQNGQNTGNKQRNHLTQGDIKNPCNSGPIAGITYLSTEISAILNGGSPTGTPLSI